MRHYIIERALLIATTVREKRLYRYLNDFVSLLIKYIESGKLIKAYFLEQRLINLLKRRNAL